MSLQARQNQLLKHLNKDDPIWHIQAIILAVIILQVSLPDRFSVGPRFGLPVLELLLLILLSATTRRTAVVKNILRRVNTVSVLIIIGLGNIYALQRLSHDLLVGGRISNGHELIRAAINIYLTNVVVFALLYWEIDGGGPAKRSADNIKRRDFVFAQMTLKEFVPAGWRPSFIDYLALSGTNALAFSPTDTMPITRRAKLLMLVQAFVALATLGLAAARAVNILG
ncbi:MAG: hypothetical protein JWO96_224 [Candidatus Saccharibacteria bacterium]|nr:hypothetical protein [Candidatus Saccharibacteria bacterium]